MYQLPFVMFFFVPGMEVAAPTLGPTKSLACRLSFGTGVICVSAVIPKERAPHPGCSARRCGLRQFVEGLPWCVGTRCSAAGRDGPPADPQRFDLFECGLKCPCNGCKVAAKFDAAAPHGASPLGRCVFCVGWRRHFLTLNVFGDDIMGWLEMLRNLDVSRLVRCFSWLRAG